MDNPDFIEVKTDKDNGSNYIPGVCNIGPAEIERRKYSFYMGAVGFLFLSGLFLLGSFSSIYYWLAIIVIFVAGVGLGVAFFQWYDKFCVGFAFFGVFNFGELGSPHRVENEEALKQDRLKMIKILGKSVIIGIGLLLLLMFFNSIIDRSLYTL